MTSQLGCISLQMSTRDGIRRDGRYCPNTGSRQGTGAALRPSCQQRVAMEMHIAVIAQMLPDEKVPVYPVTHRAGKQVHSAQAIELLHAGGHILHAVGICCKCHSQMQRIGNYKPTWVGPMLKPNAYRGWGPTASSGSIGALLVCRRSRPPLKLNASSFSEDCG